MTRDSEIGRPIAASGHRADDRVGLPGLWPTTAVAVLSSLIGWSWLMSGVAAQKPPANGEAVVSQLAPVDDQDVTDALTTMSGPNAFLAQFKGRTTGCPRPLAWVSLARAPGQPHGTVRLLSGSYFSPIFELADVPVRVAIPYPSPYEMGHGALTAMDAGGSAIIALMPAWQVSAQAGKATRQVTWPAANRCNQSNG